MKLKELLKKCRQRQYHDIPFFDAVTLLVRTYSDLDRMRDVLRYFDFCLNFLGYDDNLYFSCYCAIFNLYFLNKRSSDHFVVLMQHFMLCNNSPGMAVLAGKYKNLLFSATVIVFNIQNSKARIYYNFFMFSDLKQLLDDTVEKYGAGEMFYINHTVPRNILERDGINKYSLSLTKRLQDDPYIHLYRFGYREEYVFYFISDECLWLKQEKTKD